jgi:hypothetical protein
MPQIKSVFDWVKEIQYNKRPWSSFSNEEHDIFSNFMVNKIISMNPNCIEIVAEIQEFPIPKEKLYQFYCQVLPKSKTFSKYIKPTKSLYTNEVLGLLASYFEVSTREILDYCNIISKQDIIDILLQTGLQDKEIKKLLK